MVRRSLDEASGVDCFCGPGAAPLPHRLPLREQVLAEQLDLHLFQPVYRLQHN
jgi:hypothetical protein